MIKLNGQGRFEHVARLQQLLRLARQGSGVTVSDAQCSSLLGNEEDARRIAGRFGLLCQRTEDGLRFKLPPPRTDDEVRRWLGG
jgi:hypothetical protein